MPAPGSLLVMAAMLTVAPAAAQMKVLSEGKAIQIKTDEFRVFSERVGRELLIEVRRPDTMQPGRKTPVIYATDGGFGIVGPAAYILMTDGKIPRLHVVSIGYPNERGRHVGPRGHDLTHGRWEAHGLVVEEGGGPALEAFILNDLRPFIESRYPVDHERAVLFGHSMGGLFVANVLANHPEAFIGYLIGGVPLAGQPSLLDRVRAVAHRGNGRRVYIGYVPADITRLRSNEFSAALTGPGSTFKVLEENYTDEKHNSEILMLAAKGFRFLLPTDGSDRVAITLAPEKLDRLVGDYRLGPNQTLSITREASRLFATMITGQDRRSPVELFAESDTSFFARTENAQVTFSRAGDRAQELTLVRNDLASTGQRVP